MKDELVQNEYPAEDAGLAWLQSTLGQATLARLLRSVPEPEKLQEPRYCLLRAFIAGYCLAERAAEQEETDAEKT